MDEDLSVRVITEQVKECNDLLTGWFTRAMPRNAYKPHSERFHLILLDGHILTFRIEPDDGIEAELLQLRIGGRLGLRTTIKMGVYLTEIIDPGGWSAEGCSGLRATGGKKTVRKRKIPHDQEQAKKKN
jgi:hypothetical protein